MMRRDLKLKAEGLVEFGTWANWLDEVISACTVREAPKPFRDYLVKEFQQRPCSVFSNSFMIIVFGSVARLEPFRDLDLIVIDGKRQGDGHEYQRIISGGLNVDLNIAGPGWLKNAWKDVEWGYWLSESYLLYASHAHLDIAWRRAINLYWSVLGIRQRSIDHLRLVRGLAYGAREARNTKLPLLARLLAHEASRSLASAIIDHHGERVFSHRSLRIEFEMAVRRSGLAQFLPANLDTALGWCNRDDNADYLAIRATLSRFFRVTCHPLFPTIGAQRPRVERFTALAEFPRNDAGKLLESCLDAASAGSWLPRECGFDIPSEVLDALLIRPAIADQPTYPRSPMAPANSIPKAGNITGARWAETIGTRLKLVVNTGGCKTPSCRFCVLPTYGRSLPRTDLAKTIERSIQAPGLHELSLYNDGNLLNVREVSEEALSCACDVIRAHRIRVLAIESAPRFVTASRVRDIRQRSSVSRLSVAMGLQCVGNFFSMRSLGRPDVDALFDFAIDQIHEAGSEVRLYLLWGFGTHSTECWEERLIASVDWARRRSVERVTICSYRPTVLSPMQYASEESEITLAGLVDAMQGIPGTLIDLVGTGIESCASKRGIFSFEK